MKHLDRFTMVIIGLLFVIGFGSIVFLMAKNDQLEVENRYAYATIEALASPTPTNTPEIPYIYNGVVSGRPLEECEVWITMDNVGVHVRPGTRFDAPVSLRANTAFKIFDAASDPAGFEWYLGNPIEDVSKFGWIRSDAILLPELPCGKIRSAVVGAEWPHESWGTWFDIEATLKSTEDMDNGMGCFTYTEVDAPLLKNWPNRFMADEVIPAGYKVEPISWAMESQGSSALGYMIKIQAGWIPAEYLTRLPSCGLPQYQLQPAPTSTPWGN